MLSTRPGSGEREICLQTESFLTEKNELNKIIS